jgi:FKBP-type peptidyl-prolyl cis-trans isomerase
MTSAWHAGAALVLATVATAAMAQGSAAPASRAEAAFRSLQARTLTMRSAADGWAPLEGGVLWRRVYGPGSGPHPSLDDTVTVHYTGFLADGTEFDSSAERGPATFPLGGLIPAWQVAIPQMGVGDTIDIAVPASMGYGPRGAGPIPGGATLLFRIELLAIPSR